MYEAHTDIPQIQVEYLCQVFSVDSISKVSIEDINSFIWEQEQWYDEQATESEWQTYYEGAF